MGRMPVVFVGHGSPMNAVENNKFTEGWRSMAREIPKPKAILAISAHWYTQGSRVNDTEQPQTIYDMYGFPKALYELKYPSPGSPDLAENVRRLLESPVKVDNSWGIDHGTWSVLHHMYPEADIPVVQLSIDHNADAHQHYVLGEQLKRLRDQGVLIFASGNVVHNLGLIRFEMSNGLEWANIFDMYIKNRILKGDFNSVIDFKTQVKYANLAIPTPDHFFPLLYALGASDQTDEVFVFNEACVMGSLSMTSYLFK